MIPGLMQSDECLSCYATAALAGHGVCVSEGLETAWNGSGYFRQAMATLGVTLFVTDDGHDLTDNRVWRFPRIIFHLKNPWGKWSEGKLS